MSLTRRMVEAPGTFDENGWLRVGVAGAQPAVRETYVSTGSLYICLCGMLTAELTSLPDQATPLLRRFYEDNEAWLTGVLRRSQSLSAARAATLAAAFLAALEGAMMSARAFGDERRLADAAEWLIGHLAESAQALRKQPARRRTRA